LPLSWYVEELSKSTKHATLLERGHFVCVVGVHAGE